MYALELRKSLTFCVSRTPATESSTDPRHAPATGLQRSPSSDRIAVLKLWTRVCHRKASEGP